MFSYGGFVPYDHRGVWVHDGSPNDPAADSAEAFQEQYAREDDTAAVILARADAGDAVAVAVAGEARARVAAGTAGCFESACWSVTYGEGYRRGRSDARRGTRTDAGDAVEGYRAGYVRGYRWAVDHPEVPVRL